MQAFIAWIALGLIAGCLARLVLVNGKPSNLPIDLGVGALGAVLLGSLVRATGLLGASGIGVGVLIAALVGGGLALWASRTFTSDSVLQ